MTNVWYNAYRPQHFDEVIGQELAVRVLKNAIDKKRVKNGYLLSGSRGVGKTTLARIFANSLNDVVNNPTATIDIYEMDAASNTSVDDVRLLIENASTPPLVGDYKIFIIDEVHMLSKSAMNALLKILEEPPVYLVFVFATTNPEKILPTVLSRLIKLDLQDHTIDNLVSNLEMIAKKEDVKIDKESLELIAKKANGGQRDAINYLQTVSEYNLDQYTTADIASILGIMPNSVLDAIIYAVKSKDVTKDYKKSLIANISKLQITPVAMINQLLSKLLDDHFNGKTDNSDLIPALADYASLDLPVSNLVEVIAYLDYKYDKKTSVKEVELNDVNQIASKPQKTSTTTTTASTDAEKKTAKIVQELELPKVNSNIVIADIVPEVTADIVDVIESSDDLNSDELDELLSHEIQEVTIVDDSVLKYNKILQNTSKNLKVPINIKSNLATLSITKNGEELNLVSSNKKIIFKQSDIDFVNELFNTLIGGSHNLIANIEKPKVEEVITKTSEIKEVPKPKTPKADDQEFVSKDQFYKIYNTRPVNVPETIEIITEPIPSPKKSTNDTDQDGGIHDLFDL
jgi:DNA polymerase III subunit gamma/tau